MRLDAERLLDTLNRHGVRYVVIGGFAGVLHGLARATEDVDITPAGDDENLRRLGAALTELDALLVPPDAAPIAWPWTPEAMRNFTTLTTRTSAGDFDICLRPSAPGGRTFTYDELARSAVVIALPPDAPVAALEDVIASKAAAGRVKDEAMLPELRDLLAHLRSTRGPRGSGTTSDDA